MVLVVTPIARAMSFWLIDPSVRRCSAPISRPTPATAADTSPARLRQRYRELLEAGGDRAAVLRQLVLESGLRRREVYEAVVLGEAPSQSSDEKDRR